MRPDYAKENPDIVRGVIKALVRAMHFIVEGPENEHLFLLRARFSGVDEGPLLESLRNLKASLKPDGRITQKSVDANVKFLKEAGLLKTDVPWTAVATNEFLTQ